MNVVLKIYKKMLHIDLFIYYIIHLTYLIPKPHDLSGTIYGYHTYNNSISDWRRACSVVLLRQVTNFPSCVGGNPGSGCDWPHALNFLEDGLPGSTVRHIN